MVEQGIFSFTAICRYESPPARSCCALMICSPQCQSEDLSQWQPDPAPAAMQMTYSAGCLPNGQAQLAFAKAGEQALVRTIPTPGFSTVHLTATGELSNAGVVAQIWKDGKLLAERGNGGNIDVQADIHRIGLLAAGALFALTLLASLCKTHCWNKRKDRCEYCFGDCPGNPLEEERFYSAPKRAY